MERTHKSPRGRRGGSSLQSRGLVLLLWVCALGAIAYSADQLFVKGILSWHRQQKDYYDMMAEVTALFCVFTVLYGLIRSRILKAVGTVAVLSVFFWGHMVFLPVVTAGVYLAYLTVLGEFFCRRVLRLKASDGAAVHFLCGSLLVILVFCLMSAVGIGAIGYLQVFVAASGILLVFWRCARCGKKNVEEPAGNGRGNNWKNGWKNSWGYSRRSGRESESGIWLMALCFAFIVTMFCIQAGRMNTALDFDSLWYGVRSRYVLDNGNGIYENMGTIGIVYTYSKGWEVMTLPLANLPSYSFLLAFNLWLTAGVIFMAYQIARFYMGKGHSTVFAALLAGVPGIMNMAITTKTDIATLLFQEIMIYYLLKYLKEGRWEWRYLAYGFASFFLTWTLKPTALVFSTAILGMSVLFLLWKRLLPLWGGKRKAGQAGGKGNAGQGGALGLFLLSILALAGIWARTVIITGLPVTSVFSSILTKLGLEMKYPFNVNKIPNSGAELPFGEQLVNFIERAFGFLLRPLGVDMDHVILAWGGFLLFIVLLLWIFSLFYRKNVENDSERLLSSWLNVVFIPFLIVCVVSLYMLVQVDGNYFMLLYVLAALYVMRLVVRISDRAVRNGLCGILVPVMCFCAVVSSLTNWSWVVGFSPVSWNHHGYYDHQEAKHQEMVEKGNGQIWDILAEDPENRLIAVGDHPGVLGFPCNAQSYDDITGSWGNVVLVKTMDNFVEFMDYAKTDYVYTEAGYMEEEQRCYSLVRTLIEYGKLIPICYEEGNMLARVEIDGEYTETSRAALTEFDKCYIKKNVE